MAGFIPTMSTKDGKRGLSVMYPEDCSTGVSTKSKRQKSGTDKNDYICIHVSGHGSTPEDDMCTKQTIYDSIYNLINSKNYNKIDIKEIVDGLFDEEYTEKVYTSNAVACGMSNLMMEGERDGDQSLDSMLLEVLYNIYNPKGCTDVVTDEHAFEKLFFDARMQMRTTHISSLIDVLHSTISAYNSAVYSCTSNGIHDLKHIDNIELSKTWLTRIAKNMYTSYPPVNIVTQLSGNYLVSELNTALKTAKDTITHNKLRCKTLPDIGTELDMQALISVTLNDLPSVKVYNANTITKGTPDFYFDIQKPENENNKFDAIYGLNIVYMKLTGKRITIPMANTRNNVKNTIIPTGCPNQNISYRNITITNENKIALIANSNLLSGKKQKSSNENVEELKEKCLVEILAKLNTGNIYYSDLYLLFRWCLGIKNIAFFFPACRTCTEGFSVKPRSNHEVCTPHGGKRTAGKQTRKKRNTQRKKYAVKTKKRVNGVKKSMKKRLSKKKK